MRRQSGGKTYYDASRMCQPGRERGEWKNTDKRYTSSPVNEIHHRRTVKDGGSSKTEKRVRGGGKGWQEQEEEEEAEERAKERRERKIYYVR